MSLRSVAAPAAALVAVGLSVTVTVEADDAIRINQIQVIGTHNSYHIAPHPNVLKLIDQGGRGRSAALDYTHRPFDEQFDRLGIRQVELDIFVDSKGGHFANPAARSILKGQNLDPGADPGLDGSLLKPGLKLLHVQDVDYLSRTNTFAGALSQIRDWSIRRPRHVPILILVETKQGSIPLLPTQPEPFGAAEFDAIDTAVRQAFGPDGVITPDLVRGDFATLAAAVQTRGWPTIGASRGKVIVALDDEGAMRDTYLDGHPALRGRSMFVSIPPEHPAAGWMKVNDPVADFERIQTLVQAGFLVRTRADADTVEARTNDPSRRDKAFASGAQFISTDYPEPDPRFSPYEVRFRGGTVARTNPVVGPPTAGDLEDLKGSAR